MTECRLGSPTKNDFSNFIIADRCDCDKSCEPHKHEADGSVMCLHDGETDHGHCPQNPWRMPDVPPGIDEEDMEWLDRPEG